MHIISSTQFTRDFINKIFDIARDMELHPSFYEKSLQGKILLNVFFEPSTRTSLSFEYAMKQMGGEVIAFNQSVSSMMKGESYEDTIRTLACYGDIMILRDPNKTHIYMASRLLNIPLINAGNGAGEHPTQALLDLYTIYKAFKQIENKHILFIGDVKNSRTIHSLIELLKLYPKNQIYIWPYVNCEPSHEFMDANKSCIYISSRDYDVSKMDVIYCTRYQKERSEGSNIHETHTVINKSFLQKLKPSAIIMHPLPRNDEMDPEIDDDKRCVYFDQMRHGVTIRKALLYRCLNAQH